MSIKAFQVTPGIEAEGHDFTLYCYRTSHPSEASRAFRFACELLKAKIEAMETGERASVELVNVCRDTCSRCINPCELSLERPKPYLRKGTFSEIARIPKKHKVVVSR